jgi:hypothetical protein
MAGKVKLLPDALAKFSEQLTVGVIADKFPHSVAAVEGDILLPWPVQVWKAAPIAIVDTAS